LFADLIILLGAFVIIWVIASFPAYLAGKLVTAGRATFGAAMGATLGGVIVYGLTVVLVGFFLGAVIGPTAILWGVILGFVAFLGVYRAAFHTSWLGAFGIAVLSMVVALILNLIIGALFGVSFPAPLPHRFTV